MTSRPMVRSNFVPPFLNNLRFNKADWMANLCAGIAPDAHYDLHNVAVDNKNRTVIFFATFKGLVLFVVCVALVETRTGTHTGDKGPMKATKKEVESHYVYVVRFDAQQDLIVSLTKIWNDNFAFKQLRKFYYMCFISHFYKNRWGWAK
jgi:hypothetical protein